MRQHSGNPGEVKIKLKRAALTVRAQFVIEVNRWSNEGRKALRAVGE